MLVFRKAEKDDIETIAELEKMIFSDAWSEKSVYDTFLQKQAIITVAENAGKVCGYCILYYVLDEGEIARVAIDQTMRRAGIGKGLLEYTYACCNEFGIRKILLDVRESNEGARGFYRHMGFEEDGIRKGFYENPKEDAVLMSLPL